MGQKHGKAIYHEDAKPFLNLSFAAVGTLWETFNNVADSFGINLYEFREICGELAEELQLNRAKLDKVQCTPAQSESPWPGKREEDTFQAVREAEVVAVLKPRQQESILGTYLDILRAFISSTIILSKLQYLQFRPSPCGRARAALDLSVSSTLLSSAKQCRK